MENHNKGRVLIYTLGGGYLIYLAYKLFTSESTDGNVIVSLLFSVFFLLMGIVILGFAVHIARNGAFRSENGGNGQEEISEENTEIIEESLDEKKE